ncbi:MAG: protein kinase [Candidatus Aminicenantes bacterium]|jgi:serine/threonine-protein kinase
MDKIGKYNILGELGRGAMGVVFKGEDPLIGRIVAIKIIRLDAFHAPHEQAEAKTRFIREAQSAGNLTHPNIVTIYDVGEAEGTPYIAMEYIEGQSLEHVIISRKDFTLYSIFNLISQIGNALDYAHQKGIVHRDIKPGNILLDNTDRAHIVDFGIARVSTSTLTQSGTSLGTPSYMSPEQVAGRQVDHRSDIFALGVILYELLTYQKPFFGDSYTTVIYKIMNEDPPPLRTFNARLPEELDFIIRKALAKKPEERYQTCRQLADDLSSYQTFGTTLVAESPVLKKKERKKQKKEAKEEIKEEFLPAEPPPPEPKIERQTRTKPIVFVLVSMVLLIAAVTVFLLVFMNQSKPSEPLRGTIPSPQKTEAKIQPQTPVKKPEEKVEEKVAASETRPPSPPQEKTEAEIDVAALLDSGTRAFNKGDFPQCIQNMENILKIDPHHSTAEYFLAEAKKRQEEQSKETKIRNTLGEARRAFQNKNYADSIQRAQTVLAIAPGHGAAKNLIIQSRYRSGIQAFDRGKYEQAIEQMEEVLKLDPGHEEATDYITRARQEQAEQLRNLDVENTLILAEEAFNNQDYQDCIQQSEKVLILEETNQRAKEFWTKANLKIGAQAYEREQYEQCIQRMESILKVDPQNSEAKQYIAESQKKIKARQIETLLIQAQNAYQDDKFEETLDQSKQALQLDPDSTRAKEFVKLASIQLAPKQINAVVGEYIQSVKSQSVLDFYKSKCTPEFYRSIQEDIELITKLFTDLKVAVSSVSIQFKDITHAHVNFTHILTGVSKADGARNVLSEGIVEWEIKKQDEDWKIIGIRYSTQQKK